MAFQTLITLMLIGLATTIVGRRFLQMFLNSSQSGCGSCRGCSGGDPTTAMKVTPLVQLGMSAPASHGKK